MDAMLDLHPQIGVMKHVFLLLQSTAELISK